MDVECDRDMPLKGFNDILPASAVADIETKASLVLERYAVRRVYLPVLEASSLFRANLGEVSDVVSKQMFTFRDNGGRELTMRPEGTAGAARAFVESGCAKSKPSQRWWYSGDMFRAEQPQRGRYRQFRQLGVEIFGREDVLTDVEVIAMSSEICRQAGLADFEIRVNLLPVNSERAAFQEDIRAALLPKLADLCPDCTRRLDVSPLHVLDCQQVGCRAALLQVPDIDKFNKPDGKVAFQEMRTTLADLGFATVRDKGLVRGLGYYTGMVFEVVVNVEGRPLSVAGGGRYDDLLTCLGAKHCPAVGFAIGLERLALCLAPAVGPAGVLLLCWRDDVGSPTVARLAQRLRQRRSVVVDPKPLRHQGKIWERVAKYHTDSVVVIGAQELGRGTAKVIDRRTRAEEEWLL